MKINVTSRSAGSSHVTFIKVETSANNSGDLSRELCIVQRGQPLPLDFFS